MHHLADRQQCHALPRTELHMRHRYDARVIGDRVNDVIHIEPTFVRRHFNHLHSPPRKIDPWVTIRGIFDAGNHHVVARPPVKPFCDMREARTGVGHECDLVRAPSVNQFGRGRTNLAYARIPAAMMRAAT